MFKKNFARHEIPSDCITDNGPQFVSLEYKSFVKECGSIPSFPYYSQGNGNSQCLKSQRMS